MHRLKKSQNDEAEVVWNHPLNATTQSNETTKSTWQRADVGFPSQPIAGVVQFRCRPPSRLRYKECRNVANNKHSSRPWTYTHTHARALKRDSKHITHRHYHLLFLSSLSLGLISDFAKTWFPRNAAAPPRTGEIFIFTSILWAFFPETWAWKSCAGQECLLSFDLLRCMNLRNWWLKWARITAGVQRFAATHT